MVHGGKRVRGWPEEPAEGLSGVLEPPRVSCGGCLAAALTTVVVAFFALVVFVLPHSLMFASPQKSAVGLAHGSSAPEVRAADAAAIRQDDAALDLAAPAPRWTRAALDDVRDRCETTQVVHCSRTTRRMLYSTVDPGATAATASLDRALRAHGWTPVTAREYDRKDMTLFLTWTA